MATEKPNYVKPIPPKKKCETCGREIKPVAYRDTEGWVLSGWDCEGLHDPCPNSSDDEHDWPFIDDEATVDDLEEAGFVTV